MVNMKNSFKRRDVISSARLHIIYVYIHDIYSCSFNLQIRHLWINADPIVRDAVSVSLPLCVLDDDVFEF